MPVSPVSWPIKCLRYIYSYLTSSIPWQGDDDEDDIPAFENDFGRNQVQKANWQARREHDKEAAWNRKTLFQGWFVLSVNVSERILSVKHTLDHFGVSMYFQVFQVGVTQTSPERQFQSLKTHWCRSHLKCRSWTSLHLRTTSTLCAVSNIVTSGSPWSWHHLRTSSACASVWSRKYM